MFRSATFSNPLLLSFDPPTQHWWTTTCWTVSSVQKQSWQGQCMRQQRAAPYRSVAMATVWQSTASKWCWRRTSLPPTASSTSSTRCLSLTQVNPTSPTLNANIFSNYLTSVITNMSSLFDPYQPRMGWRWWDNLRALSAIWCRNWDWLPFWVRRRSTHSLLLKTLPSRVSWSLVRFWLASDWHSDSTSGEDVKENSDLAFLSSKRCWVTSCCSLRGRFQAHIFNLSLFCVFVRGSDVNRPERPEIHFGKPHLEAQSHT